MCACALAHCRITAALQTTSVTPTPPSVLCGPCAPDTASQRLRAKGNLPLTRTSTSSLLKLGRTPGSFLFCLHKRSTTAPSGAWAAPKHDSTDCRSRTAPARRPFPSAPNRPWFRRRSTWQTTGWRTTWRRFSPRRRGAFEWSTMGLAGMTAPLLPPHPPRCSTADTDSQMEILSAEVGAVCCFVFCLSLRFSFLCKWFFFHLLSLVAAVPSTASRSLSQKKNGVVKPHQVKMTQMPGMVRLGRREVNRPQSPTVTDEDDTRAETPPPLPPLLQTQTQTQVSKNLPDSCFGWSYSSITFIGCLSLSFVINIQSSLSSQRVEVFDYFFSCISNK